MSNAGVAAQTDESPSFADPAPSSRRKSGIGSAARASSRKGSSGPLVAPSGPTPDEVNRKKFEEHAGRDAGKVLFRSVPSGASVFVNHMLVGDTPLLLFLAPGKYEVAMRGVRQESGQRVLAVTPKQTQTVVIDLNQRYPSGVSLKW